jgi:hypothetical protein
MPVGEELHGVPDPSSAAAAEILRGKRASVIQCLELDRVDGGVSVTVRVSKRGIPLSLAFAEKLAPTTKVCVRDALKRIRFPDAQQDYELAHTFMR